MNPAQMLLKCPGLCCSQILLLMNCNCFARHISGELSYVSLSVCWQLLFSGRGFVGNNKGCFNELEPPVINSQGWKKNHPIKQVVVQQAHSDVMPLIIPFNDPEMGLSVATNKDLLFVCVICIWD